MRHRLHALCPYFAMFPETFVQKHLAWSKPGDVVFDPFSGRGTTAFEALLNDRQAAACDTNSVAACVSRAKVSAPPIELLLARLRQLESLKMNEVADKDRSDFFDLCFHADTYRELLHLREHLSWQGDRTDCFIAATALGLLHGESHRSDRYFSNRMPRTISTKPDYSVRWWSKNGCAPPRRKVFDLLRAEFNYRYVTPPPASTGRVEQSDARVASSVFPELAGQVSLVITSPPYLDTTNFAEDQWLRLWFLGGSLRPDAGLGADDRYIRREKYWEFLTEAWMGVAPLLREDAHIVMRMGGSKLTFDETTEGCLATLEKALDRPIRMVEKRTSDIAGGQLRSFRPNAAGTKVEFDYHFAMA